MSDGSLWTASQGSPPSGACQAQNPCPTSGRLHPGQGTAVLSNRPRAHLTLANLCTEIAQFCVDRWRVVTKAHQMGRVKDAAELQVTEDWTTFPRPITSSSLPGVPHSTLHPLEISLIWYPVLTPP